MNRHILFAISCISILLLFSCKGDKSKVFNVMDSEEKIFIDDVPLAEIGGIDFDEVRTEDAKKIFPSVPLNTPVELKYINNRIKDEKDIQWKVNGNIVGVGKLVSIYINKKDGQRIDIHCPDNQERYIYVFTESQPQEVLTQVKTPESVHPTPEAQKPKIVRAPITNKPRVQRPEPKTYSSQPTDNRATHRGSIAGYTYVDTNGDSRFDQGDEPIQTTIQLIDDNGRQVATKRSGFDGAYSFENIAPGSYKVSFVKPQRYTYSGSKNYINLYVAQDENMRNISMEYRPEQGRKPSVQTTKTSEPTLSVVTKTRKEPKISKPKASVEKELLNSSLTGYRAKHICADITYTEASPSISLTPTQDVELKYMRVLSDSDAVARVRIRGGDVSESISVQLAPSIPTEINFQNIDLRLKAGTTYTISMSPKQGKLHLADLKSCKGWAKGDKRIKLTDKGSGSVFYDIGYNY